MKGYLKYKLPSGALQFTVFISVIIALILSGVLLLSYTHRYFIEQSKAIIDNVQLADTGIIALAGGVSVSSDTISIAIPNTRQGQIVRGHLSHWGLFEKAFVKTTHRKKTFIKCCLLGTGIASSQRPAIYLAETFNPLAVVGTTHIEGDALLPQYGIRPGNISGNSYYGTGLLFGNIKNSGAELPELKYDYQKELKFYTEKYQPANREDFISIEPYTNIAISFKSPLKGYYSEAPVMLENMTIQGNIIIRSLEKITVRRTALLKDIILAAPVVIIEDGVTGNFQAIANTTLKVGKECRLQYPSALVLTEKENASLTEQDEFYNKIVVAENSVIRGSICYLGAQGETDYKVNVFIDKSASVKGEIYCDGNLELRGNVAGTVYAYQFLTNESGTVFVNHLYDTEIISTQLPESFGGILMNGESKSIMKWLY